MANYLIQDTTLTAIGDALRDKLGETRPVETEYAVFNYWINSFDEDVVSGEASTETKEARFVWPAETAYIIAKCKYYSASGASVFSINDQYYYGTNTLEEIRVEGNIIWLECGRINAYSYSGCYCEIRGYDADGNLVLYPSATETEFNGYKPEDMPEAINSLEEPITGVFDISGDCSYRFYLGKWNWFIDRYRDRITTSEITNMSYMFDGDINGNFITEIPFDLNIASSFTGNSMVSLFEGCKYLETVPLIKGNLEARTGTSDNNINFSYMFSECQRLREIPEDYFWNMGNEEYWNISQKKDGRRANLFRSCYSLRKLPDISMLVAKTSYSTYCLYNYIVSNCYVLDEITNFPVQNVSDLTSNWFSGSFSSCHRLKNLIFITDNGTPQVANWKSQTIDLSIGIGYIGSDSYDNKILDYNSGITIDDGIFIDEDYQLLKDNPNSWTRKVEYSRYNHDSAVATINSLPDTSAYLATAGGTNTIKFKGEAGSLTDGGAINTLTEEEIAVATAKGWTVSLV